MDVSDQLQEVRVFLADDGLVSVLKQMTCPFVSLIKGDGISCHETPHDLAERGLTSA